MTKSGIYQITNLVNKKIYIGSAVSFVDRWKVHRHELKSNKHHNRYLQRAWNKYGESNFKFEVIEAVENIEYLLSREQYWLDFTGSYNKENGYNISKIAGSNLGITLSEETRNKMSVARKGNKNSLGHKHTEESKQKMSSTRKGNLSENHLRTLSDKVKGENNHTARLTESQVLEIRRLVKEGNLRDVDIANQFGITRHMVYSIKTYRTWKHVS